MEYLDLIDGITLVERVDDVTGLTSKVVVDYKQATRSADLRPRLQLKDAGGEVVRLPNGTDARYFLAPDSILSVENGAEVAAGDVLARIPREGSKTRDITGGLPRVAELFEARRPKDHAIIAETDGRVEFGKDYKAKRRIIVKNDETGEETEYLIPKGKHVSVQEGDFVRRGDPLVDGPRVPHDILKVLGVEALSDYLVNEIQDVYRLQRAPRGRRGATGHRHAGAAGHHQGQPADAQLHQRRLLPGDDAGAHRGRDRGQGGQSFGAEGERDRRPADSGGHGQRDEPAARRRRRARSGARPRQGRRPGDHRPAARRRVARFGGGEGVRGRGP